MLAMVTCATMLLPGVGPGADAQRADTTVRVAGSPRYSGVATLVEEISIGVTTGADEYMLGQIADVAGAYIGQVQIPPRTSVAVRNGDHLWTVVSDEDDVHSLKRYRI